MVPRHVTWTGYRAIGRTVAEAKQLHQRMKDLENAGAYAAELEVVPHNLARWLCSQTKLILMSLGSGNGCDTQFFSPTTFSATTKNARPATRKLTAIFSWSTAACKRSASRPSANTSPT